MKFNLRFVKLGAIKWILYDTFELNIKSNYIRAQHTIISNCFFEPFL